MARRQVVVTSVGAITPLGNNAHDTWRSMSAGRSGVRKIATFDASTFPVQIAGQVSGFDARQEIPDGNYRRHLSRAGMYAFAAARQAMDEAPSAMQARPSRRGVAIGGTVGRIGLQRLADMAHESRQASANGAFRQAPSEIVLRSQNTTPALVAKYANCQGPLISVSTACAAAGHAIGEAYLQIRDGNADAMLCGGFDALTTWLDVVGFSLLGALTPDHADDPTRACKPFDAARNGFVLGEGAVIAMLEEREHAVARGAKILGHVTGYASSLNAYRITDSPPDGGGAISAMRAAIHDSGLAPSQIDYIVAHGTGTPGNDASETRAIKEVFGREAENVAISSPKSMAGHLTSAAAGLSLIAAIGAIQHDIVPPTINLDKTDPSLGLNYVPNTAQRRPVSSVLVNAFAFGGTNACFVVSEKGGVPHAA